MFFFSEFGDKGRELIGKVDIRGEKPKVIVFSALSMPNPKRNSDWVN
jgi:hypothetical protein